MGKKILSQVQVKISKTNTHEKKQLNSLVKVLRPKVYITDRSSFKTLVQDLTGNGRRTVSQSLPSPSSSSSSLPQIFEKGVPVIDVEDHDHGNPESSLGSISFDASFDSFHVCNHLALNTEEINRAYDPLPFDDTNSLECIFMNQPEDSFVHGDLQSLLLDNIDEHYPAFNVDYSQIPQDVSIYDYELSGLI